MGRFNGHQDEVCPGTGKGFTATGSDPENVLPFFVPVDEFILRGLGTVPLERNIISQQSARLRTDLLTITHPDQPSFSLVLTGMLDHCPSFVTWWLWQLRAEAAL